MKVSEQTLAAYIGDRTRLIDVSIEKAGGAFGGFAGAYVAEGFLEFGEYNSDFVLLDKHGTTIATFDILDVERISSWTDGDGLMLTIYLSDAGYDE